jgi:hypothetical protein
LGIALIHARPYQPQGKGKVERFFRTVRSDFSRCAHPDLNDFNLALDGWIRDVYHNRQHRSTQQTPLQRYAAHCECARSAQRSQDHFANRPAAASQRPHRRSGRASLEAPIALIGKQITLLYHAQDLARVEARHDAKSYGMLTAVDLNVNCHVQREKDTLKLHIEPRPLSGGKLPFSGKKEAE